MNEVIVSILGVAQDGGIPQAGCNCKRCLSAHENLDLRKFPVSCGVIGIDDSFHMIEVSRQLSEQLKLASDIFGPNFPVKPDSVIITHGHLGHIDGLGLFGKEVMGVNDVPLISSEKVINLLSKRGLVESFICREISPNTKIEPTPDCGFSVEFLKVPHRDEETDTHAIIIRGPKKSLLFLPDHDSWDETFRETGTKDIRDFLNRISVDIALIDGTFWDENELKNRKMDKIPHPTISESLELLGKKRINDPEIYFIHLNHTNPANDETSIQRKKIDSMGWGVVLQGSIFSI
jgi:pyrroloquinoline quinone biosynthesis protein B